MIMILIGMMLFGCGEEAENTENVEDVVEPTPRACRREIHGNVRLIQLQRPCPDR
ncbi:MAG: hypothetical protein IJY23_00170 [Clostridia bacterium]|nr:hypothetical protein [Clostridia bacterium]